MSVLPGAVRLPDGCWIRGRSLRRPAPPGPDPDFGLYAGARRVDPSWPCVWLDWPDFRLPRDREQAVREIQALYARAREGQLVEAGCGGGVGRTGTVIACLAVLAGVDPDGAVAWTRAAYHPRAVETPWQRRWVARFPRPAG
jgi:protein-tyrosine phosphatase